MKSHLQPENMLEERRCSSGPYCALYFKEFVRARVLITGGNWLCGNMDED